VKIVANLISVNRQTKNRLLNEIGAAIAALRRALEYTEDLPDEASLIEDDLEALIDLSNQVEGL
jgi:hypothetical protein